MKPNPKWRGDPTFLKDVLEYWGLEVKELSGWLNRGHGDFGAIQGIIIHHIGSNKFDPWGIARHPTLGLCSQIHLSREGVVTLCGVGIAYHAGKGSYPGWPTDNANWTSIGIEAESNGTSPWPKEQMDAYHKLCAAILWFLGKRATTATLLSHWEYSLKAQGKWDPGAGNGRHGDMLEMNHFRERVNYYIDNPPFKKEKPLALTFESVVSAVDKTKHRIVDLVRYTDHRVYRLHDHDFPRLEEKVNGIQEELVEIHEDIDYIREALEVSNGA